MSSGSTKLSDDFEQVKKLLESYPDITLLKTEGDPPEQYDIEYSIKGYKVNPDGSASPENRHQVRITLPFGYPHFPPTARPLTPIFHPDIDPDAIRIADFWQKNPSLPELIVHIGQMICGNSYTTEEPFNQAAADWFEERKSWLPFDILEPRDEEGEVEETDKVTDETAPHRNAETVAASAGDLDILKDDIEFPFDGADTSELDAAIDLALGEQSGQPDAGGEVSLDLGAEFQEEDVEVSFDLADEPLEGDQGLTEPEESVDVVTDLDELSPDETVQANDEAGEIDDLFSLDTEEGDQFSGVGDLEEAPSHAGEESGIDDLFSLDSEEVGAGDEPPLEFDAGDLESAFASEEQPEKTREMAPEPDELPAAKSDDEDTIDFGIDIEPADLEDELTADLSGLEEEAPPEEEPEGETLSETESTEEDEEKILSALSLDEEFSADTRAEDQSIAIRALIDKKQIFSAKKAFADFPDPEALPDRKELELTIADAIGEAEDLFKKADKHEQRGEFEKAGIMLDLVANIAADFPGLEFARNRIREAMMNQGEKKEEQEPPPSSEQEEPADEVESGKKAKTAGKKKKAARKFRFPGRLAAVIAVILFIGALAGTGAYVFNSDSGNIHTARISLEKAEQLIGAKNFKSADRELQTAATSLDQILFFQSSERDTLAKKISELRQSKVLQEGLKGRVLYGDRYVTVETAKAIDKFKIHKGFADQMVRDGKLEQAISSYEKALPYAEQAEFAEEAAAIRTLLDELRLELTLAAAAGFEEKLNWAEAVREYNRALELGQGAPPEKQREIVARAALATYRLNFSKGLQAVNASRWQDAVDAFQNAKARVSDYPELISAKEKKELENLLIRSLLFRDLSHARRVFDEKKWEEALAIYNDAISLLEKNRNVLGSETETDISKIRKTILTTHVAREQHGVATSLQDNDLAAAVSHYEKIAELIESSPFAEDPTLAEILSDARSRTEELRDQLLIEQRQEWLTENYDKIFRDNYPSARLSELMNPKVRYIKRDGNKLVFNLSCTEQKQGSKFRLELNYQFDLDKETWSIYAGRIDED
ncbi:MAG: hypothetical protein Kow0089_01680 [Desulfobulbaceae bacterium]